MASNVITQGFEPTPQLIISQGYISSDPYTHSVYVRADYTAAAEDADYSLATEDAVYSSSAEDTVYGSAE